MLIYSAILDFLSLREVIEATSNASFWQGHCVFQLSICPSRLQEYHISEKPQGTSSDLIKAPLERDNDWTRPVFVDKLKARKFQSLAEMFTLTLGQGPRFLVVDLFYPIMYQLTLQKSRPGWLNHVLRSTVTILWPLINIITLWKEGRLEIIFPAGPTHSTTQR